MNRSAIILMGPYLCGKSTTRQLLAETTGLPALSLSPFEGGTEWQRYYNEAGWDQAVADRLFCAEGFDGLYRYMKPFEAYAIEHVLADHPDHIIELSATQSVYEDEHLLARVHEALAPFANVVLLVPAPDLKASHEELRERYWKLIDIGLNEYFINHPSNAELATMTIYAEGKSPQTLCAEILAQLATAHIAAARVILIGPPCVGKTTLARLLSIRLNRPHYSLDALGWGYYAEAGYDHQLGRKIREAGGFAAYLRYMEPFAAHAVRRFLEAYDDCVVDFGAAHSVYEEAARFAEVRRAISPRDTVILLQPSSDREASVTILKERRRMSIGGVDAIKYVAAYHAAHHLAKLTVYTKGKRPEDVRDEIMRWIRKRRYHA